MLGQLVWQEDLGQKVMVQRTLYHDLPVERVALSQHKWWLRRRMKKAVKLFSKRQISRILVPEDFDHWELFHWHGITGLDNLGFLRAFASQILIAKMSSHHLDLRGCTVALRGYRTERDMVLAAQELAFLVRDIAVSAPVGGEGLRRWLQRECGLAVRPDTPGVEGAICFDESASRDGGVVVGLYQGSPDLLQIGARYEAGAQTIQQMQLLTALWETGKLNPEQLEFT